MRCHNQFSADQIPEVQMQPPQQMELPGASWQTFPPQVVYNSWIAPRYYPANQAAMSPLSPRPPPLPQSPLPASEEQPPWFQSLVAAVSEEVKHTATKPTIRDGEGRKDVPADLSAEDERILINALKRQKESTSTMQEVFEELSQNGHTENDWKTWFIDNYERLESKAAPCVNVGHGSEESSSRPSQSSTTTLASDLTQPRKTSRPMWEESSADVNRGSTSHDRSDASVPRGAPRRGAPQNGKKKTSPAWTRVRSRAGKLPTPVTPTDLRAIAQYRFEKGDDAEMRRYGFARWREFAACPENRKRTLAAWISIPRLNVRYAAAIDRYVEEYQKEAEAAKPKMPFGEASSLTDPENVGEDDEGEDEALSKRKEARSAVEDGVESTVQIKE